MLGGTDKQSLFGGELKTRAAVPQLHRSPRTLCQASTRCCGRAPSIRCHVGRRRRFAAPTCCPGATAWAELGSRRAVLHGRDALAQALPTKKNRVVPFSRRRVARSTYRGCIMNERMTLTWVVGLLAAALFAVGCSDSVSPFVPRLTRPQQSWK